MGTRTARVAAAAVAALAARATLTAVRQGRHADRLERTNFRGRRVSLAGGPALAVGASLGAVVGAPDAATATAVLTAGLAAGAVGMYDDIVGARPDQRAAKGFAGHLAALRHGRVTAGMVKIAGIGAAGLAAGSLLGAGPAGRRCAGGDADRCAGPAGARAGRGAGSTPAPAGRDAGAVGDGVGWRYGGAPVDVLLTAGVVAGTANLLNLLDLRPGRALKAGVLLAAPLSRGRTAGLAAGTLGAVASLLPMDLDEEIMLGDAGANALGAVLGVALAARTGRMGRITALLVLTALTAASEKVSFTQVIGRTPVLRELDAVGRRPF